MINDNAMEMGIAIGRTLNTAKKAFRTLGCFAGIAGCLLLSVLNLFVLMIFGQYEIVAFGVNVMQILYYIGIFGFIRLIFNKSFLWIPRFIKPVLFFIFKPIIKIFYRLGKKTSVEDCWVDVYGKVHRLN